MSAEAGSSCATFLCDYLHTQFDPAHLLSETVFSLVQDVVIGFLLWGKGIKPYLARREERLHQQLDAEHHVEHHDHSREELSDASLAGNPDLGGRGRGRPGSV